MNAFHFHVFHFAETDFLFKSENWLNLFFRSIFYVQHSQLLLFPQKSDVVHMKVQILRIMLEYSRFAQKSHTAQGRVLEFSVVY